MVTENVKRVEELILLVNAAAYTSVMPVKHDEALRHYI